MTTVFHHPATPPAGPMPPRPLLGVLGGMGPAATAEFLRLLSHAVPAATDQEHPRVLLLSDPGIPDRSTAIMAGSDAPLPPIRDGLLTLASWGADLLAVPCNTAHVFIDRIRDELPVPLVHIIDATVDRAVRTSPDGSWLAATDGTLRSGLYQRRAAARDYRLLTPGPQEQQLVHRAGVAVKAGRTAEGGELLRAAAERLWRYEPLPLLAACTELPIAATAGGLPAARTVSSLAALAAACRDALFALPANAERGAGR